MRQQSFYQNIIPNNELPFRILIHASGQPHVVLNHWHDSFEIDYVVNGENENFYLDGSIFNQTKGEIVVINPYQVHGLNLPREENRVAMTVMIPLTFLKQLGFEYTKYRIQNVIKVTDSKNYSSLEKLFLKLYNISSDQFKDLKKGYLLNQIGLIYQIMGQLLNDYSILVNTNNYNLENMDSLEVAIVYMNKNYQKNLQISDIAEYCNMSNSYFAHTFKKFMNEPPMQYLNQIRINHSLELLRKTNMTMNSIAMEIGFPNVKSFNKEFKKQYNLTPHLYKKQNLT